MNNDRRTFLDGSTAPRKPLTKPLTEGAMKAAMEDWLEALPKPAVKEFFGVQKKFPNPKDKKMVDAKNLEILKKYKIKPLINDPSHRESLSALSCCLDMLVGGQGESVEVDGDSIEEVTTEGATKVTKGGKIVKKEKPKNTKGSKQTKKPYFMDYPNKYEEVTTEAYDPYSMTGPVWDAIFAFQKAEKAGQKSFKGFTARIAILAKFMKLTDHVKILKLLDQICDLEGGKADDKLREYSRAWYTQIVNMFQTKYPKESEKAWGGGASGFPTRAKQGSGYQDQGGNQIGNNRGGGQYQGGNQIGNY